ncbi:MAG: C39 family peptidase [Patescibacteria group bacterium]|jgi:hypothetical protein
MSKKTFFISLLVIVLGFGAGTAAAKRTAIFDWIDARRKPDVPVAISHDDISNGNTSANANINVNSNINTNSNANTNSPVNQSTSQPVNSAPSLPVEINLKVPFTSQAPTANWDLPFQEACEETAALMVHYYLQDKTFASKDAAETTIKEVVAFEEQHYGNYKDTTAVETARFIKDMWGYQTVDIYTGSQVTLERIKHELADGNPVIVLAAGRLLGNPNYKAPGPIYHALVIKGYKKNGQIITNDPGTRKGADYVYDPTVLMNAIHDWNGGDVDHGQKNMIVIRENN